MKIGKGSLGVLGMVMTVLLEIFAITVFASIISPFNTLYTTANATWIAFGTVLTIIPTLIFLAMIVGGGIGYWKSYRAAASGGVNGFLIMVVGILEIILFVSMFSSVVTGLAAILTSNVTNFIALSTIVGISPTLLFLLGIFACLGTAIGGYRQGKKGRSTSMVA